MSLFYGAIGFVMPVEDPEGSGIWVEKAIERSYRGNVSRYGKRWDSGSQQVNPNLTITNTISIVADPFVSNHLYSIRYIRWLGSYWEVSSAEVETPRITLSIGGVYNGPTDGTSSEIGEHPGIK